MKRKSLIPTTLLAVLALANCGGKANNSSSDSLSNTDDTQLTDDVDSGNELTSDEMAAKLVADFETALTNSGSVVSATYDSGMSYNDAPYEAVSETLEFGSNNVVHYTETSFGVVTDHYVFKDGNDIYAYNVDSDGRILPDYIYEEDGDNVLKGPNVTNFGFYNPMGYGVYFYSFEEIAKLSADAALENSQNDRVITMPTAHSYDVTFNASYSDEWFNYYYKVSLKVEFDEETGALTKLSSETWNYSQEQVEVDTDGYFEVLEDAEYSRVVNYEATVGTRNEITVYNIEDFYFTSFGLSYNGSDVAQNSMITVDYSFGSYDPISFQLSNVVPATASSRFDEITVTVIDKVTGEETYDVSGSLYNGNLDFYPNAGGEFTVTLTSRDFSFTFDLKVNMSLPSPESLTIYQVIYVEDTEYPEYSYYYNDDPAESYSLGSTVGFIATAEPYGADASCSMELTCNGNPVTITPDTYEYYGTYHYYVATFETAGTYVLTATSTVDSTVTASITFTVA